MTEELIREDVLDVIDRTVEELLQKAGLDTPPVDAIVLAQRHLGMIVCLDRRQPQRGRAHRSGGQKQIFLRPDTSEERHQWTVAHEIGEHLKADLLHRLQIEPAQTRAMSGESLANLFAHRLLVPTCWFAADAAGVDYDLSQLKDRYRTASHEVIALRFLDLSEPCVVAVVDNDHVSKRRSNSLRVNRQLSPAEEECRRLVSQDRQTHLVRRDGWTVQGWPIHQDDWKREILRSLVEING